jgi:pyridoxal phosphate enzyme (YggS family)
MQSNSYESEIKHRLEEIQLEIERACQKSGRSIKEVQILAISKKQSVEVIRAAYDLGIHSFGESYLQEAQEKMELLADLPDLHWEMVGHIQSRKAKDVAKSFDRIHSLDSIKLADLLSKHRPDNLDLLEAYLEVNLAGEASKGGFLAKDQRDWEALFPIVERVSGLSGVKLVGLMAMPPLFEDPEEVRPYFVKLRELRDVLNKTFPDLTLNKLSAGTSSDFGIAIEEGATVIRIGERLLGPRDYSK